MVTYLNPPFCFPQTCISNALNRCTLVDGSYLVLGLSVLGTLLLPTDEISKAADAAMMEKKIQPAKC